MTQQAIAQGGAPLLAVENLRVAFGREAVAVDGVSFCVRPGETLGLVGESGSGKTTVALSILRLLPASGRIVSGSVRFEGIDLLALNAQEMRRVRGRRIAMIFQEPGSSLDPLMSIASQMEEAIQAHSDLPRSAAARTARQLLSEVGIRDPDRCLQSYPHQLSGGMLQRVLIATALSGSPLLMIGDEPTSALDVTVQGQILDLLGKLRETRALSILLISHDLAVIAQLADRVAVMYGGQIVESAPAGALFEEPCHPYTRQLLASLPGLRSDDGPQPAAPLQRQGHSPMGCRYANHCPEAVAECRMSEPELFPIPGGRQVRCLRRLHLRSTARAFDNGPS